MRDAYRIRYGLAYCVLDSANQMTRNNPEVDHTITLIHIPEANIDPSISLEWLLVYIDTIQ